jgi:hypothetical protein
MGSFWGSVSVKALDGVIDDIRHALSCLKARSEARSAGGQQVPYHGPLASAAPSVVHDVEVWLARLVQAQAEVAVLEAKPSEVPELVLAEGRAVKAMLAVAEAVPESYKVAMYGAPWSAIVKRMADDLAAATWTPGPAPEESKKVAKAKTGKRWWTFADLYHEASFYVSDYEDYERLVVDRKNRWYWTLDTGEYKPNTVFFGPYKTRKAANAGLKKEVEAGTPI